MNGLELEQSWASWFFLCPFLGLVPSCPSRGLGLLCKLCKELGGAGGIALVVRNKHILHFCSWRKQLGKRVAWGEQEKEEGKGTLLRLIFSIAPLSDLLPAWASSGFSFNLRWNSASFCFLCLFLFLFLSLRLVFFSSLDSSSAALVSFLGSYSSSGANKLASLALIGMISSICNAGTFGRSSISNRGLNRWD